MDPGLARSKVPAGELGRKPMQGMMERDLEHSLDGCVRLCQVSLEGERSGRKRGRWAPGKRRSIRGRHATRRSNPGRATVPPGRQAEMKLTAKNALFAGHDEGASAWGRIASLIETCKMNGVEPYAWLESTLETIAAGHPQARIRELLHWNFASASS